MPESPSSRSAFHSHVPSIDAQLSSILPPSCSASSFPPFFLFVDATGPRGRRLLRWTRNAVAAGTNAAFAATLVVFEAADLPTAFASILAHYRRTFHLTPSSPPLRLALAGSDALLNHLLPPYIAALTASPTLPLAIYPVPLHAPPCRVAEYLAWIDNRYLSLFFSSRYRHALEGEESVEAEGDVVLEALHRYVMDAAGETRLTIGEAMIETTAPAFHPTIDVNPPSERRPPKRDPTSASPPSSFSSPQLPHPPPVQVPSAVDLQTAAPPLHTPAAVAHAVSAPVLVAESAEAEATTPPHASTASQSSRLTLPFISSIAFQSNARPRTSSDSELHSPRGQQTSHERMQSGGHGGGVWAGEEGEKKEGGGGVVEKVERSLNKFWVGMKSRAHHSKQAASTVYLPPAGALHGEGVKPEKGRRGRTKRRNSDSQTHFPTDTSASSLPAHTRATSAASPIPLDLTLAPLLGRSMRLTFWSNVSSKGKERARRGSLDEGLGGLSGSAPGAASAPLSHAKKYSAKGSFERLLVQRLLTAGSGGVGQGEKGGGEGGKEKRSFIAALTDRQHSHPTPELTLAPQPSLAASTSSPALPSSAPAGGLAPVHVLLLGQRGGMARESLLTRLASGGGGGALVSRPVTKVIASGGREGPRWGVVVDGVEVEGVSMVSVSAQVSGRVKAMLVHTFTGTREDRSA